MKVEVNGERKWQRCVHKERPFLPHRLLFVDIYQHLQWLCDSNIIGGLLKKSSVLPTTIQSFHWNR